jgi:hypothetical protein
MLSTLYATGFVLSFLFGVWVEISQGERCCWHHDATMAVIITVCAVGWPALWAFVAHGVYRHYRPKQ